MKKALLIAILYCGTFFTATAQNRPVPAINAVASVKLYPNPATSFINFDFGKTPDRNHKLQIYNFMGRKMFEQFNLPERVAVNLTDYARGVYIYQIKDNAGRIIESGKFQVSK